MWCSPFLVECWCRLDDLEGVAKGLDDLVIRDGLQSKHPCRTTHVRPAGLSQGSFHVQDKSNCSPDPRHRQASCPLGGISCGDGAKHLLGRILRHTRYTCVAFYCHLFDLVVLSDWEKISRAST